MSERLALDHLSGVDLVPQATIGESPANMTRRLGIVFDRDVDDLDSYSAAFFKDGGHVFGFIRHDGEPQDTLTLYLERTLGHDAATGLIDRITQEFAIPAHGIIWRETLDLRPATV